MSVIRRLDHVAILVRDTQAALEFFTSQMGLMVIHAEESEAAGARLTYLELGNAYLQLIEPARPESALMQRLQERGEGLHHVCFGVDDVSSAASVMGNGTPGALGSGRGRVSAFVPGSEPFGVLFECTEFVAGEDVADRAGWLADPDNTKAPVHAGMDVERDGGRRET